MPERFLFVGPTLPDAAKLLADSNVQVLPPIAAYDLLRLDPGPGDVIGIVDGYFHHSRSITHKEILVMINRGVRVLGAASMGALRAAELDTLGMTGIGEIYADYTAGLLEADDEVTLLHGLPEHDYRPLSEPLVNMRATLAAAERQGYCSPATRELLIGAMAERPYAARCYRAMWAVGRDLGVNEEELLQLASFVDGGAVDQKREDALLLLDALREPDLPRQQLPSLRLSRTLFVHGWELENRGEVEASTSTWISDLAALRVCQLLATDYPLLHRNLVLDWLADQCRQECRLPQAGRSSAEVAVDHGEHWGLYRVDSAVHEVFLDEWLTEAERGLTPRQQLALFLVRSFRIAPSLTWDELALNALRGTPAFARARRLAAYATAVNTKLAERDHSFHVDLIAEKRITEDTARRWGVPVRQLELAALDRGLGSAENVVAAGRYVHLLAKYNPEEVRFEASPEPARAC
ncbi:TfuA-like protein [Allokutzneria sp. A3M-2-11 16]|uniref:TfuA-like protein n=1 Tax=Allokutzneria sp. A3M-2-11 16 TaxID=2962043 RepID=UPI0020B70093|nr:TfuA-like protein [Allokutzneria sp. A3M-2-11 16]MCP3805211.1 TfuA-like protein [Allokutzneria sp. A3M-2-11 16]